MLETERKALARFRTLTGEAGRGLYCSLMTSWIRVGRSQRFGWLLHQEGS